MKEQNNIYTKHILEKINSYPEGCTIGKMEKPGLHQSLSIINKVATSNDHEGFTFDELIERCGDRVTLKKDVLGWHASKIIQMDNPQSISGSIKTVHAKSDTPTKAVVALVKQLQEL